MKDFFFFFSACPGSSVQEYCKICIRAVYTIYYGAFQSLLSIACMHIGHVYVHINMHANIRIILGKKINAVTTYLELVYCCL